MRIASVALLGGLLLALSSCTAFCYSPSSCPSNDSYWGGVAKGMKKWQH